MKSILKTFLAIFISLIMGRAYSHAQGNLSLDGILTYENYQELLKYNVARIPELRGFWELGQRNGNQLKLNGGKVRGFLHWHTLKLQTFTPEQIRSMAPPSLRDCEVLGGNDLDIVGPANLEPSVRKIISESEHIDYIDTETNIELNDIGGPTIEKININPLKIDDPFGGLKSYYHGELAFHSVEESVFRRLDRIENEDYSKTTEALRFIRFLYNLPEAKANIKSVEEIRKIADEEWPHLVDRDDKKEFIFLTLGKLLKTRAFDLSGVLLDLQKFNILKTLSKLEIYYEGAKILADNIRSGKIDVEQFSIENLIYIYEILGRPKERNYREFLNLIMSRVKTSADFIQVIKDTSVKDKAALSGWISDYYPILLGMHPTPEELSFVQEFQFGSKRLKKSMAVNQCRELFK